MGKNFTDWEVMRAFVCTIEKDTLWMIIIQKFFIVFKLIDRKDFLPAQFINFFIQHKNGI